jgi:hypothetical protein
MEPDRREDQASERQPAERATPHQGQATFNPPFANDGLEQLRDSHC